jgi:hypothetical protein
MKALPVRLGAGRAMRITAHVVPWCTFVLFSASACHRVATSAECTGTDYKSKCRPTPAPQSPDFQYGIHDPRVTFQDIHDYAAMLKFNRFGESHHALLPVVSGDTAYADIWPEIGSDSQSADALRAGRIVSKITLTRDYTALGLRRGVNYVWVYYDGKQYRGVILQDVPDGARTDIKYFRYQEHVVGGKSVPSRAVAECTLKNFKACFVDSDTYQVIPQTVGGGQSLPWTWCALYGCCCGGSACYNTSGAAGGKGT